MPGNAPPSSRPYRSGNIEFVGLPPSGGSTLGSKLGILFTFPKVLGTIRKYLKLSDAFQLRTPFGMGVLLIPYLTLFCKKKGWYKYAGNWSQQDPPPGYRLQRWWLKHQSRTVTINGKWPDQPPQCLSFENPCLTKKDRGEGQAHIDQRHYQKPFNLLFVGRLEDQKGVQRIIDTLADASLQGIVDCIHLVGDGGKRAQYEAQCKSLEVRATFYGFLSREEVFALYRKCDFLLLPTTASEGFPKVLAEAMNFGCIPVVSDISSIGQYISPSNGFVLADSKTASLRSTLQLIEKTAAAVLLKLAKNGHQTAGLFTYDRYNERLKQEVLKIKG
jgi:glycosyltransferase involved in cell wall biosynthesis